MTPQSLYEILREEGVLAWALDWDHLPFEQKQFVERLHARIFQ